MKILFNYLDQTQQLISRLDLFESWLRYHTLAITNSFEMNTYINVTKLKIVSMRVQKQPGLDGPTKHGAMLNTALARGSEVRARARPAPWDRHASDYVEVEIVFMMLSRLIYYSALTAGIEIFQLSAFLERLLTPCSSSEAPYLLHEDNLAEWGNNFIGEREQTTHINILENSDHEMIQNG